MHQIESTDDYEEEKGDIAYGLPWKVLNFAG